MKFGILANRVNRHPLIRLLCRRTPWPTCCDTEYIDVICTVQCIRATRSTVEEDYWIYLLFFLYFYYMLETNTENWCKIITGINSADNHPTHSWPSWKLNFQISLKKRTLKVTQTLDFYLCFFHKSTKRALKIRCSNSFLAKKSNLSQNRQKHQPSRC